MKLFFKAGTCALAPHIVMAELGLVYELEAVDLATKVCASGDYRKINPKGSVPALKMDNGEILTEGAVISQYLADHKPEAGLLPKLGTLERLRCQEWLNYTSTEVHKTFSMLFGAERLVANADARVEFVKGVKSTLATKLTFVSEKLGTNDYLLGKQFTVADAYLFTCLTWSKYMGVDLAQWPNVVAFQKRVSERPAVIRAMKEEGLL